MSIHYCVLLANYLLYVVYVHYCTAQSWAGGDYENWEGTLINLGAPMVKIKDLTLASKTLRGAHVAPPPRALNISRPCAQYLFVLIFILPCNLITYTRTFKSQVMYNSSVQLMVIIVDHQEILIS